MAISLNFSFSNLSQTEVSRKERGNTHSMFRLVFDSSKANPLEPPKKLAISQKIVVVVSFPVLNIVCFNMPSLSLRIFY